MEFKDLSDQDLAGFSSFDGHETVRRFELRAEDQDEDKAKSFIAYIAVHNTNLGPGLGGCRVRPYGSEEEALNDVLRLSRGMTYKNAVAGLPLGGGKSVIIADPAADKTPELMEAMGRAVESLSGRYVTAEDSGTGEEDMIAIARRTSFVTGLPPASDEALGGNPSPVTAWGVYHGIRAAVRHRYGKDTLAGLTIGVQGAGAVGIALCALLHQEGAKLLVSDIDEQAAQAAKDRFAGTETSDAEEIYDAKMDIFAPCAMGGILNDDTIARLNADIVAGAANNQLLHPGHDQMLSQKNILYVPDYVINAGGVICVGYEYFKESDYNPCQLTLTREGMMDHVGRISDAVTRVLESVKMQGVAPGRAADDLAQGLFSHPQSASGARAESV